MTDVFLGVIAVSTLAMAIGQVAAVIIAARAARRVGDRLGQLEETIRPIVANVQRISDDLGGILSCGYAYTPKCRGIRPGGASAGFFARESDPRQR